MSPERYVKILIYDLDKIIEIVSLKSREYNMSKLSAAPKRQTVVATIIWAENVWLLDTNANRHVDFLIWLDALEIIRFDYYLYQHEQRDYADEYPVVKVTDITSYLKVEIGARNAGIDDDLTDILRI